MNTYDIGDKIRITGTWTDTLDAAVDPSTIVFSFKTPGAVVDSYTFGIDPEVVRVDTGVYYVDLAVDEAGKWSYRFAGTGSGAAAAENTLSVRQSEIL